MVARSNLYRKVRNFIVFQDATEPSRGNFQFSRGDQIANLAAANGQLVRGHTTVWHSQLPSWVSNGQWTVAELTAVVRNHVTTVVDHYRGQMCVLNSYLSSCCL